MREHHRPFDRQALRARVALLLEQGAEGTGLPDRITELLVGELERMDRAHGARLDGARRAHRAEMAATRERALALARQARAHGLPAPDPAHAQEAYVGAIRALSPAHGTARLPIPDLTCEDSPDARAALELHARLERAYEAARATDAREVLDAIADPDIEPSTLTAATGDRRPAART